MRLLRYEKAICAIFPAGRASDMMSMFHKRPSMIRLFRMANLRLARIKVCAKVYGRQ